MCPLFGDVMGCLRGWKDGGGKGKKEIMIYSSGSIPAQKLLFQHTDSGDLTPLVSAYFDTTTAGPKTDSSSYQKIISSYPNPRAGDGSTDEADGFMNKDGRERKVKPEEYLFLSDNVGEVKAALEAGMRAAVVVREGNTPVDEVQLKREGIVVVRDFGEVDI